MQSICFLVAFGACIIGKICGMGGGVIIKPALDALGIMQVAEINFLSGCTVLGMTCWSVGKSMVQHESQIDLSISTPLAIGAAVGGMAGKQLFSAVAGLLANADTAGGIQAALLCTATFSTLLYTIRKDRLTMLQVRNPAVCVLIGLGLGMLGTFLGIGGGPFNMAVLFFFFFYADQGGGTEQPVHYSHQPERRHHYHGGDRQYSDIIYYSAVRYGAVRRTGQRSRRTHQ